MGVVESNTLKHTADFFVRYESATPIELNRLSLQQRRLVDTMIQKQRSSHVIGPVALFAYQNHLSATPPSWTPSEIDAVVRGKLADRLADTVISIYQIIVQTIYVSASHVRMRFTMPAAVDAQIKLGGLTCVMRMQSLREHFYLTGVDKGLFDLLYELSFAQQRGFPNWDRDGFHLALMRRHPRPFESLPSPSERKLLRLSTGMLLALEWNESFGDCVNNFDITMDRQRRVFVEYTLYAKTSSLPLLLRPLGRSFEIEYLQIRRCVSLEFTHSADIPEKVLGVILEFFEPLEDILDEATHM